MKIVAWVGCAVMCSSLCAMSVGCANTNALQAKVAQSEQRVDELKGKLSDAASERNFCELTVSELHDAFAKIKSAAASVETTVKDNLPTVEQKAQDALEWAKKEVSDLRK